MVALTDTCPAAFIIDGLTPTKKWIADFSRKRSYGILRYILQSLMIPYQDTLIAALCELPSVRSPGNSHYDDVSSNMTL